MVGSWQVSIPTPFDVGLMLLLTDGSIFSQDIGTSQWWRLFPDRAGRYATGEWRRTAQSTNAPLHFASAVLADGTVFIAGGQYKNNDETVTANLATVESYDPVADKWRALPSPGWTKIGNAPCCVLPDGKLLLGNITAGPCALWNPDTKAWVTTSPKDNGSSSEETWTLLPDGSVLTADCVKQPAFERFDGNVWLANGASIPLPLVNNLNEIGPAILLPDGRVFALGATENTAFYANSVWTPGPLISGRSGFCAKNTPACLLPNGRVLCAARPINNPGPIAFFELDPVSVPPNWFALQDPPGQKSDRYFFLLLPTGQILVSNGTRVLQLFQPVGNPNPGWAPSIRDCPTSLQVGTSAILKGMQLNGLSQACSGGNDAAMATNYPLVRLRAPSPSDTVIYCRTAKHSTMGVATGKSLHSTEFTVPLTTPAGIYYLCVVANGIASAEQLVSVVSKQARRRALPAREAQGEELNVTEGDIFGEEELFLRDLSEVHLLIDFISGRGDKSLAGLSDIVTVDSAGGKIALTPQRVVEEICMISYPPEGSLEATAQQAAFMLVVKDKLNSLATPARGLTIAFTSMFAGVALKHSKPATLASPEGKGRGKFFSARIAYPNLERDARRFRSFYQILPKASIFLVLLIVYTNWDISVTTALQQQMDTARTAYTDLFASGRRYLPTDKQCSKTGDVDTDLVAACNNAAFQRAQLAGSAANLHTYLRGTAWLRPIGVAVRVFGPREADISSAVAPVALACLTTYSAEKLTPATTGNPAPPTTGNPAPPTAGNPTLPTDVIPSAAAAPPAKTGENSSPTPKRPDPLLRNNPCPDLPRIARSPLEDFLLAVVNALNTIVTPAAFGFLGTYAGLMRSITLKVRDSVLAPRDYQVAWVSIPLGMIAGLAVGLFFNNQNAALGKAAGSTITLTAAGLSFLAGFGSESFFEFLTTLLTRLMPPEVRPPTVPTIAVPPSTANKQG